MPWEKKPFSSGFFCTELSSYLLEKLNAKEPCMRRVWHGSSTPIAAKSFNSYTDLTILVWWDIQRLDEILSSFNTIVGIIPVWLAAFFFPLLFHHLTLFHLLNNATSSVIRFLWSWWYWNKRWNSYAGRQLLLQSGVWHFSYILHGLHNPNWARK